MKYKIWHIKYGKIIQRSTGTKLRWSDLSKGSGRPRTVKNTEKEEVVKEIICPQEIHHGIHVPPKDIIKGLKISQSSIFCMENDKKTIQKSQNTLHEWCYSEKKSKVCWLSSWKIRNKSTSDRGEVFQDESDFRLQIAINSQNDRVYFKGQKEDIPDKILSDKSTRESAKVMVSAPLKARSNKATIR